MTYLLRVELHKAGHDAYRQTHAALEAVSFERTFFDYEGKERHLPTGTYLIESANSPRTVLLTAMKAVLPIEPNAEFVVSAGGPIISHNCPEVTWDHQLAAMLSVSVAAPTLAPRRLKSLGFTPKPSPVATPDLDFFSAILGPTPKR